MSGVTIALIVVASVALVVVVFVVVPALTLRTMAPILQRRIDAQHVSADIVRHNLRALGLGLESKGAAQLRGNGALVLTADELHWFQLVPESDLRIPRQAIAEVKTVRSHLGKTLFRDLLYVAFEIDGKRDAFAWYVNDLDAWRAALEHRKAS